jgi:hypothetical protein
MCSGKVNTSCTTTGTRCATLITNLKVSYKRGKKDGIVTTTLLKSLNTYFVCIQLRTKYFAYDCICIPKEMSWYHPYSPSRVNNSIPIRI